MNSSSQQNDGFTEVDLGTKNNELMLNDESQKSPSIEVLNVTQSSEVKVGNSVVYHGPVTVQQIHLNGKEEKVTGENASRSIPLIDLQRYSSNKKIAFAISIAILFIMISFILSITLNKNGEDDPQVNLTYVEVYEWHGKTPEPNYTFPLELPATRVIIAHTVTEQCFNLETCSLQMRMIQNLHIGYDFGNIGYNFVIGGDGRVYVGRGWKLQGAHTKGWNKRSIGIAFIGDFTSTIPTKEALKEAKLLLDDGVEKKFLSSNYKLLGHRQVALFASPGDMLYKEIQSWSHWTANVYGES
ncbi:peptidoglycan-recognition protein 1-like isoform X2 [Culicoides brevitarsis]|uniref:peptidoglycan-recognition protein 1-like isoform X2 n=1 Tax=Culicoides brevitarsis TaxID=469753 RepID=UPI00307C5C5B